MTGMERLEILVGFGGQLVFLIQKIGVTQRKFSINGIRAERIRVAQFVVQLHGAHVVLFTHGVVGGFKDLLARCLQPAADRSYQ